MKKSDIKVGEVYSCKVSGNIVAVRIDSENFRSGWDATNLKTNKSVRIKSAQRLRGKATTWPGKSEAKATDAADVGPTAKMDQDGSGLSRAGTTGITTTSRPSSEPE